MVGIWQLVLIFAIILILFGAGRIPRIMKDLGSGIRAFKKGFDSDDDNINSIKEVDFDNILSSSRKKSIKKDKVKSKNKQNEKSGSNKKIKKNKKKVKKITN